MSLLPAAIIILLEHPSFHTMEKVKMEGEKTKDIIKLNSVRLIEI